MHHTAYHPMESVLHTATHTATHNALQHTLQHTLDRQTRASQDRSHDGPCVALLYCVASCGSVSERHAGHVCCSGLQCIAVCGGVFQCVAVHCSVLQCVVACCSGTRASQDHRLA